jgi:hypothetical protein
MTTNPGFDEVMIVNPFNPQSNNQQQIKLMRFHGPQSYFGEPMGHYAEPQEFAYYGQPANGYGYYAEPAAGYGYYAEPEYLGQEPYGDPQDFAWYGEQPEYGYYADPQMGYYGEPPDYGYYAEAPEYGYYGEPPEYGYYAEPPDYGEYGPVGYFAEEQPYGWYGEPQEMVGYGQNEPLSQYPEGVGYYGEPDISGYVRQVATPSFNPGCPMPTNVAGFGETEPYAGYTRPTTVNPSCGQFTPQPGVSDFVPESFKPLW